jgi:hypothetical protein
LAKALTTWRPTKPEPPITVTNLSECAVVN